MTEERLIKAYKPIVENLAKSRFMLLLKTTQLIVFKNNGILDVYKAQERYDKIKLRLATGKKDKFKDLYAEDVFVLQQSFGLHEDLERILLRRYDFILELFCVFNEFTFDITDINRIIENSNEVYEKFFKENFEHYIWEKFKRNIQHLVDR